LTFLSGLAILFLVGWLLNIYSKRHPEKKKLATFISSFSPIHRNNRM
jgi:hypothetical protein